MRLLNIFLFFFHAFRKNVFFNTLFFSNPSPFGLYNFLGTCARNGHLLDVGCANGSPIRLLSILPTATYTGIDITQSNAAVFFGKHNYWYCPDPAHFASHIKALPTLYDIIISNHNLEHCNDQEATLTAMSNKLAPGGRMYIAVPSLGSINFPTRQGTLNYYDDPTHKGTPPDTHKICRSLENCGMTVLVHQPSYKPLLPFIIGSIQERDSKQTSQIMSGTWAYYGFESIIWATRLI